MKTPRTATLARVARALAALVALAALGSCKAAPTDAGVSTRSEAAIAGGARARYAAGLEADRVAETQAALTLAVREIAGVERRGELATSGLPLARNLGITDPARLTLVDAQGKSVPAQFDVLARWDAGLADARAPIQWVHVAFPAQVAANGEAHYRLITDGSAGPNPAPAVALRVEASADRVRVDTGAAVFVLDATSLLAEASLGGTKVIGRGQSTTTVSGKAHGAGALRSVVVERQGPLTASVIVKGTTRMPAEGGGGLAVARRYVFHAGSPTALIQASLAWEGQRCSYDVLACDGRPNALRVDQWREKLELSLGPARTVLIGSAFDETVTGRWSKGQRAHLRQLQRAEREAPPAYQAVIGAEPTRAGTLATAGILSVADDRVQVSVAIGHLHRLEPQALRALEDGSVALDLVDEHVWLAARQGLSSEVAVSVTPAGRTRADLDRELWAPLNHPLRPWPSAEWWATSGAVPQFPVGPLTGGLERYDALMLRVLSDTFDRTEKVGLYGLTTWGSFPRYWHQPYGLEVACDDDPTPGQKWDDTYWCTTWTDYHNTSYTAAYHAMRTGEIAWIDEILVPAARRMLHTQILQCAPGDTFPFCGKAATGYRAFRSDANSSHQYWDSLFLYYWLTGDRLVIDTITPGMDSARQFSCSRRAARQGACSDGDGPADEYWTGRIGYQFAMAYRFLGLAGSDASFLDDYRGNGARMVTQRYVEARAPDEAQPFGFLTGDRVEGPRQYTTAQLWMGSLYDIFLLERLRLDTQDRPLGQPPLAPSHVLDAWARAVSRFGGSSAPGADGTVRGPWSEILAFSWAGPRIGGKLGPVVHFPDTGDPLLYAGGKATLSGLIAGAAARTQDGALRDRAVELTCYTLDDLSGQELLLGKVAGISLAKLPAAVAILAENGWSCR